MNMEELDSDVAKELLAIIAYCNKEVIDKIPEEIIKKLSFLAADSLKDVYIDKEKPLNKQNLSDESLDFFSLIYYKYVAEGISREDIIKSWLNNDKKN